MDYMIQQNLSIIEHIKTHLQGSIHYDALSIQLLVRNNFLNWKSIHLFVESELFESAYNKSNIEEKCLILYYIEKKDRYNLAKICKKILDQEIIYYNKGELHIIAREMRIPHSKDMTRDQLIKEIKKIKDK